MKKHVIDFSQRESNLIVEDSTIKKFFRNFLWIFLVFLSSFSMLRAQSCEPESCVNGTLVVSTGYDHNTSSYISPLAIEQNWKLAAVPASSGLIPYGPSWVVSAYPAWNSFPNAQWVSAFPTSAYGINNYPMSTYGAFEFENCFCLCQPSTVTLNFEVMYDDLVDIYLDNTLLYSATTGWGFLYPNRIIINQSVALPAGQHCLRIQLANSSAVAMGFAVEGTITGANLLTSACCHPEGSICGTKLKDEDCDGRAEPGPATWVPNWPIILYDGGGLPLDTTYTDTYGNYCFPNLPAGNYIVGEGNLPGWTQSYPSSGTYTFNLLPGGAEMANFFNCPPVLPCDMKPKFDVSVSQCGAVFTPTFPALPAGMQIVGVLWAFGDGQTSTEMNPTHYYATAGGYTACLRLMIFDGEKCCVVKYCRDVVIREACPGHCELEGDIAIKLNHDLCQYNFTGVVTYAGLPVTNWFWTFGDGTTGNGSTISHQFPGPGTYAVCLYLFAGSPNAEECCFRKICTEVTVECGCEQDSTNEPADGTKTMGENNQGRVNKPANILLSDGRAIILNQNAPNPFAESTDITYDIQRDFGKAEIVFTNLSGQMIRVFNIYEKGLGKLTVFSNDLSRGIYTYSLVVDGQVIDSKKMEKQ